MIDVDKEVLFSESVKAGKRIYYFDVKQSRNGDKYVAITESKKKSEGPVDNPTFVFEKHKVFLYHEDFDKFKDALAKVIAIASEGQENTSREESKAAAPADDTPQSAMDDLIGNIEF